MGFTYGNKDHPRVCGEKLYPICFNMEPLGSPPRMRGKGRALLCSSPSPGITPAYAGKSARDENRKNAARDHPRVCGEKNIPQIHISRSTGSPPRMRGKAGKSHRCNHQPGITPAYAGKSLSAACRVLRVLGSPPRMRGKGPQSFRVWKLPRITPAYAGKSSSHISSFRWFRDHPRVCGEKSKKSVKNATQSGSPPRMRGKVYGGPQLGAGHRITPAYAGKRAAPVRLPSTK